MNIQYSLPIINPAFELLKKSSRFLHFVAAVLIASIAINQLLNHNNNQLIYWSQLIIATELFILVTIPSFIYSMPIVSILFRLAEVIILSGNGLLLFNDTHTILGGTHIALAIGYLFLLRREWRIYQSENIDIRHTGITIPNFTNDIEISWHEIKSIMLEYHSMMIETIKNKKIEISLRKGLRIDEKEAIDDFCNEHLTITAT